MSGITFNTWEPSLILFLAIAILVISIIGYFNVKGDEVEAADQVEVVTETTGASFNFSTKTYLVITAIIAGLIASHQGFRLVQSLAK